MSQWNPIQSSDLACMPITLTNSYVHTTWISKSTQWQSLQTSERTFTLCRMYVKHTITPVHIYYSPSSALSGSRAQTLVGNRTSPIESCALPVLQRKTGEGSETHTLTQPTFPFCFSLLNSSPLCGPSIKGLETKNLQASDRRQKNLHTKWPWTR